MGSGVENTTPTKAAKASPARPPSTAASSEAPSTPLYPDLGTSVQAYYSAGAPGTPQAFFPPGVASSPHPYVWGGQHLIPAYGTPIPFSPMYPHGGMYPHPSMAAGMVYPSPVETEAKEKGSTKKTPKAGNAGSDAGPGKSGDGGKVNSGSEDEDATQSEYEGSSDGRDDSSDQQEFSTARKNSSRTFREESSYSGRGQPASKLPVSAPGRTVLPNSATNLNIGMELWSAPPHADAAIVKVRSSAVSAPGMASSAMPGRKGAMTEQWVQDERELKRQKRKQSNRESARRSRLRKQQECEELAKKVDELSSENSALRSELEQLSKDCKDLELENESIVDELTRLYGEGVVSTLKGVSSDS